MRRLIGMAFLLVGVFIATYPFVSVWRLGGQVVSMAPENEQLVETDRAALAIFDEDFLLGTATYEGVTAREVTDQLIGAGFTGRSSWDSRVWLTNPCCGQYDAAGARVTEVGDGTVLVDFSVFDSDIVFAWPVIAFIALMPLGIGIALLAAGRDRTAEAAPPSETPVPLTV